MTKDLHEDRLTPVPAWTLVTSHGLALLYVAENPNATVREIAKALGLTERRVADLISDLIAAKMLIVTHRGRRNHYTVNSDARFRHPLIAEIPFHAFIRLWRRFGKRPQPNSIASR